MNWLHFWRSACSTSPLVTDFFNLLLLAFSETKIKSNCDLTSNIAIEGYDFVSKPTLTNAGGVGFFIKGGIQFHIRYDLCSTTKEFESLWIEINRT